MSEGIRVGKSFAIPERELEWRFETSGGPGGQHANRAATRVELGLDVEQSPSIPDRLRGRILEQLSSRLRSGELWISVDDTRSQWRNRALARRRMGDLLEEAARPPRRRRTTKPSRSARRRRLERKRKRGRLKELRKPPEPE